MKDEPVGDPLDEATLARRLSLPLKMEPVTLAGGRVRLTPLDLERDVEALLAASDGRAMTVGNRRTGPYDADALVWRYMPGGPFTNAADMAAWLRLQVEAPNGLCLCVRDVATGVPIGACNLMTNLPEHLKVVLRHAFALGYRRVEWKCDSLNARSRAAALRMGFSFEGIQESHFIIKGRNRDTAWFRMLDAEWPARRARLEAMLAG